MSGSVTKTIKGATAGRIDDEILSACSEAAGDYCRMRRPFGSIDSAVCWNKAMEAFKATFRKARGYSRNGAMSMEHVLEMTSLFNKLRPQMVLIVNDTVLRFDTERIRREIRSTGAEALIRGLLEEAGVERYEIVCQKYRAKATVYHPGKYKVMFIIRYKDVESGKAKDQVARFMEFIEEIGSLPFEIKVWK